MAKTVDFGVVIEDNESIETTHHFTVKTPAVPGKPVTITEYFVQGSRLHAIERAELEHAKWNIIKQYAADDFNARMKKNKIKVARWSIGEVHVDRFLGKELCVLAWAAEHAEIDQLHIIGENWAAFFPEERWFFYRKTARQSGLKDQGNDRWRRVIHIALADAGEKKTA